MEVIWRKAFSEIALKAFRKLHLEYGAWGLGQASKKTISFEKINEGPGVELAYETSVCAAITQEFINSPLTNGAYIDKADQEERRYEIHREVKIGSESADIIINRYRKRQSIEYYKFPVIIEAKRAHYFIPQIATGERGKKQENVTEIRSDLTKLKEYREKIKTSTFKISIQGYEGNIEDAFLYLLFWGTVKKSELDWENVPLKFAKNIDDNLIKNNNFEIKWMPLKWSKPEVEEWLWIMLIEVDPLIGPGTDDEFWFK